MAQKEVAAVPVLYSSAFRGVKRKAETAKMLLIARGLEANAEEWVWPKWEAVAGWEASVAALEQEWRG
jgi:hypothetical protein